jgi:hypothetical protein
LTETDGTPIDGAVSIVFTIYDDSTGGNPKWTETHAAVQVTDGLFSVILGSTAPLTDTVFADPERYLGIAVGGDPEIQPRTRLVSVGYAMQSLRSDSAGYAAEVADDAVTSTKIADGAIQLVDLGQNGAGLNQVIKWNGSAWIL